MQQRATLVRYLNVALVVVSTIAMFMRGYARLFIVRKPGLDDVFAVLAFGTLVSLSALEIKLTYYGIGTNQTEVPPEHLAVFFGTLPTMQLLYLSSTGLVRISIALFILRLGRQTNYMKSFYALIASIAVVTIISVCILLFECVPVRALWNQSLPGAVCVPKSEEATLMYAHASLGILFDFILFLTPIYILSGSVFKSMRMVRLSLLFSLGLFSAITGIVRLSQIVNIDMAHNTTMNVSYASVWTDLEGHTALWIACLPATQPIFRWVSFSLGFRSRLRSTGPTPNGYNGYQNSRNKGTPKIGGLATVWSNRSRRASRGMEILNTIEMEEMDEMDEESASATLHNSKPCSRRNSNDDISPARMVRHGSSLSGTRNENSLIIVTTEVCVASEKIEGLTRPAPAYMSANTSATGGVHHA
ncbi:hypothetical protein EJ05DRAFT_186235 [Pseudovirgaria hyperparasitica]|uniref:Rhodopsin domain-containing protein n=1 Tax=Pseudovirgaria hyperparasitica TaxID=470096 RepID=A0A6A6WJW7_9PEZI|nr:uncharacterized protein EJ05DRAFT_186235 [Pseudovirgaria hyperparasitica]KAF2761831.1 hypothetical protein EJ05DRAFT_186235 [Pseudovirgaria hyperparasitica]